MHYYAYEMAHAVVSPLRFGMQALRHTLGWPFNPMAHTTFGKNIAAACEVFENVTRRYGKPEFAIKQTHIEGLTFPVREETVLVKPFCNLIHFARDTSVIGGRRNDPKVLIVAPMSGHYATLLRGTVEAMLPEHEVYVTDWADARDIPIALGRFDFDDFVDYLIDFVHFLGAETHVIAVCQPAVPSLVATAIMAARGDEHPACLADPHGRPDRHAPQPDQGQRPCRRRAPSTGSSATSSTPCRSRIRASCARSIRASCS